jgi:hypothetical protein
VTSTATVTATATATATATVAVAVAVSWFTAQVEGIRDGRADDSCFVCGLLWPGLADCPRCEGRMTWRGATAGDDLAILGRIARGWDTWRMSGDPAWLETLLDDLHLLQPASLEALRSVGGDLDQLRQAWQAAEPSLSPGGDDGAGGSFV